MPRKDFQGMVADEQQRQRYPIVPFRDSMTDVQQHHRTQNGTTGIRDDLHRRISQHGSSEPEASNGYTYRKRHSMKPSIRFDSPQLIASSH